MPIYEFKCQACGEGFETYRTMSEGAKGLKCPKCGSSKVTQQLSCFSARSKGGLAPAGQSCSRFS
jgi:putative FmdB family regulatory protein